MASSGHPGETAWRHAPRAGVMMMFSVLFITVFVDLITAVAIGMIMASFVFMQRIK